MGSENSHSPEGIGHEPSAADRALAAYRSGWYSGEYVDPEEFAAGYPDHSEEILGRIQNFLLVAERSRDAGRAWDSLQETAQLIGDAASGTRIGDFEIIREIGQGGMGTVYEADQISLNRRVALKILPPHLSISVEAVRKFRREAEAGGRQAHSGIVSVFAVGQIDGIHYIAQELVEEGRSLADYLNELQQANALPSGYFEETTRFIASVADALQNAHETGVIHRDVKPSNILMTADNLPKLTDFGLARIEDALERTRTGEFAGTPHYMSPEQAASQRLGIDHRTDIFSLGVTLYEMLTLVRPFDGTTSQQILTRILLHEPRDPRKVRREVPRDLAVIALKALEKKPESRYATMKDMAADLRRFLSGEPIQARPAGVGTRLWKRMRRNPLMSAAVCVALLALLFAGTVVPWVTAVKEKEKRTVAEKLQKALEKQRDDAERARRKGTAFYRLIVDMLTYRGKQGRELKFVDVLDSASRRIEKRFLDNPEIVASLYEAIGRAYGSLAIFDRAIDCFRKASELDRQRAGDRHPKTLDSIGNLAEMLINAGRLEEAEELLLKLADEAQSVLDPDDLLSFQILSSLGRLYAERKEYATAESYFSRALEGKIRILGEENLETIGTLNNLGNSYWRQGRIEEAETALTRALELYLLKLPTDHPSVLKTRGNIAGLLLEKGDGPAAERELRTILEIQTLRKYPDHPEIAQNKTNLAVALQNQGRFEEAEAYFREVLDSRIAVLGENHPDTLKTMRDLALVLIKTDQTVQAEFLFRNLADRLAESRDAADPELIDARIYLSRCLCVHDKFEWAEKELLEIYEVLSADPERHAETIREVVDLLILMYTDWGKPEKAEPYRRIVRDS